MRKFNTVLLASAGLVALASAASAAAPNWSATTSSWFTAANWSTATVPAAGDIVTVGNGGNAQVNGAMGSSTGALTSLSINGASTVTLGTGNNLSATTINLGDGTTAGTLAINASPNAVTGAIVMNKGSLTSSISGAITGAVTFTGTGNTIATTNNAGLTLSGPIGGAGAVSISGGEAVFTGTNTQTGITTIASGAQLQLGTTTTNAYVDNGTLTLLFNGGTFASAVSGTGGLGASNTSGTIIIAGNNSYTGTTVTALAGTFQIGNGATSGTIGTGNLVANTAVVFNRTDTVTVPNTVSGGGALTFAAGTTILTGTVGNSGGITVSNGATAQFGNGGATGTTSGNITDNGAVIFNHSTQGFYTGTLSGSGSVTVTGAGQISFNANDTYTGGTTINSGATLSLGQSTAAGSVTGNITDNGTLSLNHNAAFTVANVISGTGGLNSVGTNTLTAADTYSGSTVVQLGTLALTGTGAISNSIGVALSGAHTASLDISRVTASTVSLKSIASCIGCTTSDASAVAGGSVVLGAKTLVITAGAGSYLGVISGTGGLTVSGGTQTLGGVNTYTGATSISAGTLALTGAGSIAASSVIADSGTLDISANTGGGSAVKALTGTGSVLLGANTLTFSGGVSELFGGVISGTGGVTVAANNTLQGLSGANTYTGVTTLNSGAIFTIGNGSTAGSIVGNVVDNGTQFVFRRSDSVTYGGVISGTGQVAQLGSGTLTLTGVNTFTGRLLVNPGTVALSGNGSVASAVGVRTFGNFDISQTNAGATIQSLDLVPVGTNPFTGKVFLGNKTLTISNANTEFDGFLQDGGIAAGTGGGVTLLAGSQTFGGANTYTGTTTITGGTLVLTGTGSIANSTVTVQNGGTLSGTGASGATTVQSGGILTPGGAGTVGTMTVTSLTLNSGAVFNADITAASADAVTSSGAASINGVLNATFATTGTYAATQYTVISASGALSGTFANFNIANLPTNFVSTLSYDAHDVFVNLSALSSTGTANVDGGTTTISGNQTTGGLSSTGSGGTVAVTSGSTLTDNQNTNTTFSGTITGAGAVVKAGTGTLILDGVNTYTGGTGITGGILEVGDTAHPGAAIQGPVTVGSGGTLQGHGTINGAVTIGSGGNLQPGGTIGTISVASASFASGSTYTVETSPTQADLLQATGAVSINSGAKLVVTEDGAASSYARTTTYTIVQAGGGLSGSFGSVASTSASFLPTVTYTANGATVTLLRTDAAAALATGANQANVATALFAGGASALTSPLAAMSDAGVQAAYGQLSGDIHASLRSAAVEDSRIVRDAVLDHLNASTTGTGVWAVGFGGYGSIATNGNAASLHHNSAGFLAGADMDVGSGFRLGLGGAYTSNNASTGGHASTASGDMGHILGYAGWSDGTIELKLGGDYGWGNVNVSRNVSAYGQVDSGRQDQQVGQVFGEFGTRIDGTPIHPYVDLASISATTGAFAEGGGNAALSGGSKTDTQTYSTVGIRLAMEGWDGFVPRVDVGWQHAFNSFAPGQQQTLQAVSQTFTVLGAPLARDAAALRAGFGFAISPDATLSLDYDGSVAGGVQNNAIRGGLDWKF